MSSLFKKIAAQRAAHLTPSAFTYYSPPLVLKSASGCVVRDEHDKEYLDLIGGIVTISVGHCHPRVTAAVADQIAKFQHTTTLYYHPEVAAYAEELAAKLPAPLDTVYFVNSGSEANELALHILRAATGHADVLALRNGYHGGTSSTMALTGHRTWKFPHVSSQQSVQHALCPDAYRGLLAGDFPQNYVREVRNLIDLGTCGQLAGFIAEPIQGVGGVVVLPRGYLAGVLKEVHSAGGLLVADEVQGGFGRTGTHYWSFQSAEADPAHAAGKSSKPADSGFVPDVVTMAKGMGNGFPLGAVVTSKKVAEKALKGRVHFNTFGGNPVCAAAGRAVLKVIDEEKLQENAKKMGDRFLSGFRELQQQHPIIGDVRGRGLMIGVELVKEKDGDRKAPATEELLRVFQKTADLGLLVGKGGFHGNVFRVKPPLCINAKQVDRALEIFGKAFKECGF